jgi:hypothetical protein
MLDRAQLSIAEGTMRASSVIVILAILIAAFLAWDAYDNDGRYRKSALNEIEHEMNGVFGR